MAWDVPPFETLPRNAQVLEGAELDFSRYGDTLFEVLFAVRGLLLERPSCWSLATCIWTDLGSAVHTQSLFVHVVECLSSVVEGCWYVCIQVAFCHETGSYPR